VRHSGGVWPVSDGPYSSLALELVEALLAAKRLIPIVDHLSELTPAAREQLLAALPAGLVLVTSRSVDFLPAVDGGDSFYAAHSDASAIGWVGAS
jgi:hypothetical protein